MQNIKAKVLHIFMVYKYLTIKSRYSTKKKEKKKSRHDNPVHKLYVASKIETTTKKSKSVKWISWKHVWNNKNVVKWKNEGQFGNFSKNGTQMDNFFELEKKRM